MWWWILFSQLINKSILSLNQFKQYNWILFPRKIIISCCKRVQFPMNSTRTNNLCGYSYLILLNRIIYIVIYISLTMVHCRPSHIIDPNIRCPLVNIRLTAITDRMKKTKPKNEVSSLQRHLHFLSAFMRFDSNSERGTSRVKSASGLPPGWKQREFILGAYNHSYNEIIDILKNVCF